MTILSIDELEREYDAQDIVVDTLDQSELSIDRIMRYKYFRPVDELDYMEVSEEIFNDNRISIYDEY